MCFRVYPDPQASKETISSESHIARADWSALDVESRVPAIGDATAAVVTAYGYILGQEKVSPEGWILLAWEVRVGDMIVEGRPLYGNLCRRDAFTRYCAYFS